MALIGNGKNKFRPLKLLRPQQCRERKENKSLLLKTCPTLSTFLSSITSQVDENHNIYYLTSKTKENILHLDKFMLCCKLKFSTFRVITSNYFIHSHFFFIHVRHLLALDNDVGFLYKTLFIHRRAA